MAGLKRTRDAHFQEVRGKIVEVLTPHPQALVQQEGSDTMESLSHYIYHRLEPSFAPRLCCYVHHCRTGALKVKIACCCMLFSGCFVLLSSMHRLFLKLSNCEGIGYSQNDCTFCSFNFSSLRIDSTSIMQRNLQFHPSFLSCVSLSLSLCKETYQWKKNWKINMMGKGDIVACLQLRCPENRYVHYASGGEFQLPVLE